MRKGFLHVIEVVIVAMLVFVLLSQFYRIPKAEHPWGTSKLTVMSQDILYIMENMSVDWFNAAQVNDTLYYALPETMGYALRIRPAVRPVINVSCVCSTQNFTALSGILTDFTLNGIDRSFNLKRIDPSDIILPAPEDTDVIVFWGYPAALGGQQARNLGRHMSMGNGVVEFANLTQGAVDAWWHREIFQLIWVDDSYRPPSDSAEFRYFGPTDRGYAVREIFDNVPPGVPVFVDFDNFASESVYPDSGSEDRILVEQEDAPYFAGTYDKKPVPLAVINWGVNGSGRSAWMSGTDVSAGNDEARQLLKALVIWAAGEKDYVIIGGELKQSAKASFRKVLNEDMYEPVRVELALGYHY
jgi:hypothetical protein